MDRKSMAYAGSWYPATADECESSIQTYLKDHKLPDDQNFIGGIVPHAGWYYSGSIACRVIASLSDADQIETIVLFGAHMHKQSEPCGFRGEVLPSPSTVNPHEIDLSRITRMAFKTTRNDLHALWRQSTWIILNSLLPHPFKGCWS